MTVYSYSISADTAAGKADPLKLHDEIVAAALASAAYQLPLDVDFPQNQINVTFDGDLDAGDQAALDAVIAAHDGEPYPPPPVDEKRTHDGLLAVRAVAYDTEGEPFRKGYSFDITDHSGPNIFDIYVDPATMIGGDGLVQLMGGRIWAPSDAGIEDNIDGVVVDKLGVIPDTVDGLHNSLMEHYGLPVDGTAALELTQKFIDKGQLDVGYAQGTGMEPGGNFEVFGGLFVRVIYNATKGSAYTGKVRLNMHWAKRV